MNVFRRTLVATIWFVTCSSGVVVAQDKPDANSFSAINSAAELEQAVLAANDKVVLLRVRADWDISDPELDKVYASDCVQELLSGFVLLLADITDDTEDHRALLKSYQIYGPPTMILFDTEGQRIPDGDILGYVSPYRFAMRVKEALALDAIPSTCSQGDVE